MTVRACVQINWTRAGKIIISFPLDTFKSALPFLYSVRCGSLDVRPNCILYLRWVGNAIYEYGSNLLDNTSNCKRCILARSKPLFVGETQAKAYYFSLILNSLLSVISLILSERYWPQANTFLCWCIKRTLMMRIYYCKSKKIFLITIWNNGSIKMSIEPIIFLSCDEKISNSTICANVMQFSLPWNVTVTTQRKLNFIPYERFNRKKRDTATKWGRQKNNDFTCGFSSNKRKWFNMCFVSIFPFISFISFSSHSFSCCSSLSAFHLVSCDTATAFLLCTSFNIVYRLHIVLYI